jgi:hypothetical protein
MPPLSLYRILQMLEFPSDQRASVRYMLHSIVLNARVTQAQHTAMTSVSSSFPATFMSYLRCATACQFPNLCQMPPQRQTMVLKLTPCNRILLKFLIVTHLIKKINIFYITRSSVTVFMLVPIVSYINPAQTLILLLPCHLHIIFQMIYSVIPCADEKWNQVFNVLH